MKSFTSQRVVKSYAVEVAAPRMLDCQADAFQRLVSHLAVVTVDEAENCAPTVNNPWDGNSAYSGAPLVDSSLSGELAQAAEEAEAIIAKARAEAAAIRRQAEREAAEILERARADEESFRRQLEAAVRAEALPQARQEGYEEGVEAGRDEAAQMRAEARSFLSLAQKALAEEYIKAEEDILHLAVLIAERLVRAELSIDPARLGAIVRSLSLLPQERQGWRLHLSSQDAAWAERLEPGELPCPWVVDESLSPGDCLLECQEGLFDARISSQLERLEETLREELRRGAVAEAGTDSGEY